MVNARELVVDDVLEHHRDVEIGLGEEGGVPSHVLTDPPEDSVGSWLGGAGSDQLGPAEPEGRDAVVLVSAAGGGDLEDGAGPGGAAAGGGLRWRVSGGVGRGVDGVGEGVAEDRVGA